MAKIKIVGKEVVKGVSKKTNAEYDFTCYYYQEEGASANLQGIKCGCYQISNIFNPDHYQAKVGEYVVPMYNYKGYVCDLLPVGV